MLYLKVYFIGGRVIKVGIACLSYLILFRAFSVRFSFLSVARCGGGV